jgi:two-component system, NtrC family, sensor kinase
VELLFNLAFLAGAALLLALWTFLVLQHPIAASPYGWILLFLLVVADLAVFVLLGSYLIDRIVVKPLTEIALTAGAISEGDYTRRVPAGDTDEMRALAASLNRLTGQLLHNQSRLEENVRSLDEANRMLIATQRELVQSEKLASIGQLAAGVAHEVGNPLGALLGYVSVLRRRGGEEDILGGIDREARRIDRIVRSLLEYARPGTQAREPVDVNASVHRVLDILHRQGRLREVTVELKLGHDLPSIAAVPYQIDQVFVNLFTNAEGAMQGAGVLTVATAWEVYSPVRPIPPRRSDDPPGVNYSHLRRPRAGSQRDAAVLEAGDEILRITVADTGPGIPLEHIDHIFDPFFTTKAPGEGTGLGLAIVSSTVTEMGGRLEVTTAVGGGAVFTVMIPTRTSER